jgi:ABC-2 type transport system permease protein
VVALQVGRQAARSGLLWGLIFGCYVLFQTLAYTHAYPTQAARDQMATAFQDNVGLKALIGRSGALDTVAGYASWRLLGILSILGAIWGLLTSTRLVRGDEEAGRYELLLAGRTTRRRAAGQSIAGLGAGLVVLFALTTVGTVLLGRDHTVNLTLGQCLYFSVTLVAGAATFLAVGALTSQLAGTRLQAAGMAGTVFGVAYGLRMVADSVPGLHRLAWLSPLGWIEQSRPLTSPQPLALLPVGVLILGLGAAAVYLAGTRDLGASTLPARDSGVPHLALLANPVGLAVRLIRPVILGWWFAVAAVSVLLGSVAQASVKDVEGGASVARAVNRLGGHGSLVAVYLGLTFLLLALMIALIGAGQISALRAEEADGHLENLVVRPVSRTTWLAGRMLLATVVLVVSGILAGLGAWAGMGGGAGMDGGAGNGAAGEIGLGSLIAAGLNVVTPALFLLGLGTLTLGVWPRRTSAVVYGYLAWSFLVEFIGGAANTSHWLLDTSVFFHLVPAPATAPDLSSNAVLVGLALAGTMIGAVLLNRRDLAGA